MRKTLRFFFLAALTLAFSNTFAQIGPDAFGYTALTDQDAGGPTYSWVDITTTGTQVTGLSDDNAVGPFAMGWDFHYYWSDYDQLWLGSNGWASFQQIGNIAHCFPTLPSPGGNGDDIIAPFMTDLSFSSSYPGQPNIGEMYWWTNNTDSMIVTYVNVPWWQNDNGGISPPDWIGSNTFQVIFSGVDSSITFQYQTMDAASFNDTPGCDADLEIGFENVTGNIGLEIANETVPASGSATKIYFPAVVTLQIPDATPAWNANSENAGQFFLTNRSLDFTTSIRNKGNADIESDIVVDGELLTLSLTSLQTWQETIDTLQAQTSELIQFNPSYVITNPGQHYYEVGVSNGQDINPSNNNNTVEVSAVEQDGNGKIALTYATLNPPDGVGGFGVNDGLGIKVVPPAYPVTIESVEMFLLHDTTMAYDDYTIEIWDDDAAPGQGTLLGTETVSGATSLDNDWNVTTLTNPITINDGGFYVSFIAGGTAGNVFMGTEAFGPISRRTYEVIAGTWATYRQSTSEDFLIIVNVDGSSIGVEEEVEKGNMTFQQYPNPTSGITTVRFGMVETGNADFTIRNLQGQTVLNQAYDFVSAGVHEFDFDAASFAPGIYLITMESNGVQTTQKMIVTK